MNKYYQLFQEEKCDEQLLKINVNTLSLESRFWHFACLSLYYQKQKNDYLEKKSLSCVCDLNYIYNCLTYFDRCNVLPNQYKKFILSLKHQMKNDKIEEMIKQQNKKSRRSKRFSFLTYSLLSLVIIPLMLVLVLVFEVETTMAAVISVAFLIFFQMFTNPTIRFRNTRKEKKQILMMTNQERQIFAYMNQFDNILGDLRYVSLIRATSEEEREIVIATIKNNSSYDVLEKTLKELKNKKKQSGS